MRDLHLSLAEVLLFFHLGGGDLVGQLYILSFSVTICTLTTMQYSVFGSILTIGAMLGAILSGTIADRVGRKCVSINPISILLTKPDKKKITIPEVVMCLLATDGLMCIMARRQWQYQMCSAFLDISL
jgi:MFS family permease